MSELTVRTYRKENDDGIRGRGSIVAEVYVRPDGLAFGNFMGAAQYQGTEHYVRKEIERKLDSFGWDWSVQ